MTCIYKKKHVAAIWGLVLDFMMTVLLDVVSEWQGSLSTGPSIISSTNKKMNKVTASWIYVMTLWLLNGMPFERTCRTQAIFPLFSSNLQSTLGGTQ